MTAKMTGDPGMLPERVDRVEQKLDFLSASVITRFGDVSHALAEQRQYTEFAFGQLDRRIASLEAKFDGRIAGLDERITRLEERMTVLEERIRGMDAKLDRLLALHSTPRPARSRKIH